MLPATCHDVAVSNLALSQRRQSKGYCVKIHSNPFKSCHKKEHTPTGLHTREMCSHISSCLCKLWGKKTCLPSLHRSGLRMKAAAMRRPHCTGHFKHSGLCTFLHMKCTNGDTTACPVHALFTLRQSAVQ